MPIIHVTKLQINRAHKAYKRALVKDAKFKKFEDAQAKESKEALAQLLKERKEEQK